MDERAPHEIDVNGRVVAFSRVDLRELGKDESFLEGLLASHPELLGLDPLRSRVSGRLVPFRQLTLPTLSGRTIFPDVIFLSDAGEVVVVEVKLGDNPELRGRRVIAQVIEYASSLPALTEDELASMFAKRSGMSWSQVVAEAFPWHKSHSNLADALFERIQNAQLHIVIATDRAPDGLRELVRSIGRQAALGAYTVHVAEVQVFKTPESERLIVVPQVPIRTEIVATTSVVVSVPKGQKRPLVDIRTQSAAELARAINSASTRAALPQLEAIIQEYVARAPRELQLEGTSNNFRQIVPPRWPGYLHYEILLTEDEAGVELHIEDDPLRPLAQPLMALSKSLEGQFKGITWDPTWSRKRGRIRLSFPLSAAPAVVAETLIDFISATRPAVEKQLEALKLFED